MKIRPMEAQLIHANGRTDTTKLIVAFLNYAKGHKNCAALHVVFDVLRPLR
jgi:hypothetical protein